MRQIDLTHPMYEGAPHFIGDPKFERESVSSIPKQDYNLSRLIMSSHQGTHLDAPSHFVAGGRNIDEMPLDWFYGPARILRIPKDLGEEIDVEDFTKFEEHLMPDAKIIYETGWHKRFGRSEFFTHYPSLTLRAAEYLASRGIKMLGMDTPTPSRDMVRVHKALLSKPYEVVIVESLANLDKVPDIFTFAGFPLNLRGCDGSPIRAVALVED